MTAQSVVGPVLVDLAAPVPLGRDRAESPDAAVDRLCRQMREVCASAVDPLEIAAALEAEAGLTGPTLRARYGCPDVFTLADEMYRRTVRWPAEPPPQPDLWAADPRTHVAHAVLYGLPAASYAVATPLLSGGASLTVVLVSMVTSWTLSQALAYLGYARLSGLDRGGAAQVLRAGLPAGTAVLGAALAAAALLAPVGAAVLVFAAAQGVYLLAATVLLVLKAERWVFAALAPGALASVAYLMAGRPASVDGLLWLPLVVTAVVACGAAVARDPLARAARAAHAEPCGAARRPDPGAVRALRRGPARVPRGGRRVRRGVGRLRGRGADAPAVVEHGRRRVEPLPLPPRRAGAPGPLPHRPPVRARCAPGPGRGRAALPRGRRRADRGHGGRAARVGRGDLGGDRGRPLRVVPGPRGERCSSPCCCRRWAAVGAPGSPAAPRSRWRRPSCSGCPPGPST